jgi:hypothetical protein
MVMNSNACLSVTLSRAMRVVVMRFDCPIPTAVAPALRGAALGAEAPVGLRFLFSACFGIG